MGTEHVVEWVTQQDVDLARRVSDVAAVHGLVPDSVDAALLADPEGNRGVICVAASPSPED